MPGELSTQAKKTNTHNLGCFQRKSLIKTVEKELLKSCKTKWRQPVPFVNAICRLTHTHAHTEPRAAVTQLL